MLTLPEFKPSQPVYTETKTGMRTPYTIKTRVFNLIWNEWEYRTECGRNFLESCLYPNNPTA